MLDFLSKHFLGLVIFLSVAMITFSIFFHLLVELVLLELREARKDKRLDQELLLKILRGGIR